MPEFKNVGPMKTRASRHLHRFFQRHLADVRLFYDHGCGYGGWTKYVADLTGGKAAIFDTDEAATAHTRDVLGDSFTESQGPFDAILCFGVLELLEEPDQVALLKTFAASLQGRLLVQYNFYNPVGLRWLALRLRHGNPIKWHEANRFHRTYFSRSKVEDLYRRGGFRIVEKCHPILENHLPFALNSFLSPLIPSRFHSLFYYALEKA
jgi:SAM-dependent methyltransferase